VKRRKSGGGQQRTRQKTSSPPDATTEDEVADKHESAEEDEDDSPCQVCFSSEDIVEDMVLCDLCGGAYHLRCLGLTLQELPDGSYFCPFCEEDGHLFSTLS